jgi:alkylation response protein AidB-like acyl-CoA dehydrogenase
MARHILAEQGTEDQKRRWLEPDPSGGRTPLLAFPMYLEHDGTGLDLTESADSSRTRILRGSCELVVNGPIADGLLLPVRVGRGLGLLVLSREIEQMSLSEPVLTLGLRGCPVADVGADGVRVPNEAVLGDWGASSLQKTYELFSGPVAALCAGIGTGSLRRAAAYVGERRQGGRRLEEYSQVRMMIASMARQCEMARTAAQKLSAPAAMEQDAAIALFISAREGIARAVQDGVQLLGGYGYMEDYGQERRMRDAKQAQMLLGRDDLRRLELAEACLKNAT